MPTVKMLKFSFENNKIIKMELDAKVTDTFGTRVVYRLLNDTYKHCIFTTHLDTLRYSNKYSYYTLNNSFTEKDYLKVLREHFLKAMHQDAIAIEEAKKRFSNHQDSLLIVNDLLVKKEK